MIYGLLCCMITAKLSLFSRVVITNDVWISSPRHLVYTAMIKHVQKCHDTNHSLSYLHDAHLVTYAYAPCHRHNHKMVNKRVSAYLIALGLKRTRKKIMAEILRVRNRSSSLFTNALCILKKELMHFVMQTCLKQLSSPFMEKI